MITYHAKTEYYTNIGDRPAAAVYGAGSCFVAGVEYASDGVTWVEDVSAADVLNATLVGLNTTAGTVTAADTILTALGKLAGKFLTILTGVLNTFVGTSAGNGTTTGTNITAIGALALNSITTGSNNSALGYFALKSCTAGSGNSASGSNALRSLTTGNNNAAHGGYALQSLTTGSANTAVGQNTGVGITTGANNTILGSGVAGLPTTLADTVILATGGGAVKQIISATGVQYAVCASPTAISGDTTLTIAQLLVSTVTATSPDAIALTLPTGTLTAAGINQAVTTDMAFEWSIINLGSVSGRVTVGSNTDHTFVGLTTVEIGDSARFRTRKTGAITFVTYRIT